MIDEPEQGVEVEVSVAREATCAFPVEAGVAQAAVAPVDMELAPGASQFGLHTPFATVPR